MDQDIAVGALESIGYLGKWEIDFVAMKVRGTGRMGPAFGILKRQMRDGVSLALCDDAYTPEHLEMIKKNRRSAVGNAGRYHLHYNLRNKFSDILMPVQSIMYIETDRYGLLKGAKGILCEEALNSQRPANDAFSREDALQTLRKARMAVECLGLTAMSGILNEVFKEVARSAT